MSSSTGVVRVVGHGQTRKQKRAQIRLQKRGRPIKLSPACCGVHWTEPIERHTTTEKILIIIQFKLLEGFSIRDLSSPTGKLWIATLEYISTIQGCTIRYWGIEITQDQEFICLLVQSDNAKQWSTFQQSLGIYMMWKVMSGRPINRCLLYSLPIHLKPPNKLEVSMFKFESETFDSAGKRILEDWIAWKNRWREEGVEAHGGWLEDDASPYVVEWADLIPAAVKGQDRIFLVLAWYWEGDVQVTANGVGKLKNEFKEAFTTAGAKDIKINEFLLSKSVQREIEFQKYDLTFGTKPTESLASLLQIAPPRRHKESPVTTKDYYDSKHIESVYKTAAGNRQYPGPEGAYTKMGNFHTTLFLDSASASEISSSISRLPDTELLWLKFEPGRIDIGNSILKILVELRESISKEVGYRAYLYWARSMADSDEWVLIISWDTRREKHAKMHTLVDTSLQRQTARRLLEDFVTRTGALTKEPDAFTFGFEFSSNPQREGFPIMEVTNFEVSNDPQTQWLFQQLYRSNYRMGSEGNWARILRDDPPDPSSVPYTGSVPVKQAGRHLAYFFQDYPLPSSTLDAETENFQTPRRSYFTTITMWRSVDAMREWYTEYAAHCDDYERLGHGIDQIRVFCEIIQEVESKVFDMVGDFYEIIEPPAPTSYSSGWPR